MFNVSKFIPNKEYSQTALIFCFYLKKTVAESYRLLREANGEHAPLQDIVNDGFGVLKVVTSRFQTRNMEYR